MSAGTSKRSGPECHVLNFFHDKDDGCALTVLCNSVRFHIVAAVDRLNDRSEDGKRLLGDYKRLVRRLKHGEGAVDASDEFSDGDDDDGSDPDRDSGVDIDGPFDDPASAARQVEEAESALQNWMLSPFGGIFKENAPPEIASKRQRLDEWYDRDTRFYSLRSRGGRLEPVEQEESPSLRKRMDGLTPALAMPKYILREDLPWLRASEVMVLDASDDPPPYHPSLVEVKGKRYFLKVVDTTQPQPTKREICHMIQMEKLGLHEKLRVPLVEGLVGFKDSGSKIMGFLMTFIEGATPLVEKLDPSVPRELRERWAGEAERMKETLHDHDVVWGDAKADNFMVDGNDDLWMIDFGGSYTEGWVDPELNETLEGDDMGVEKVLSALRDPEENTRDPEDEISSPAGKKRSVQDDEGGAKPASKRRRASADDGAVHAADGGPCCYCGSAESGKMIACDNGECERKWFHFECAGISEAPTSERWYCSDCEAP